MHAAVCRAFGAPLTIEKVVLAPPGPNEVAVAIRAVAICHSDIVFAEGGWGGALPAIFGHEAAGTVVETGAGATEFAPGDEVVVTMVRACGACPCCHRGIPGSCERPEIGSAAPRIIDAEGQPLVQGLKTAAFAEHVVVHESQLVTTPMGFGHERAALLACGVLTGYGAVTNTADVPAGASVAVIGAGGVGLNAVQAAAIRGADPVVAIDLARDKLQAAEIFGATHCVDGLTEDAVAAVMRVTGGRGVDFAFVTVGAAKAMAQSYEMLAPGGAAVLVGIPPTGVVSTFDPGRLASLSQRILGSKMGAANIRKDIPDMIDLHLAGRLKLDELITARYGFEDINEAIAQSKAGAALRNVIVIG